MKRSEMVEHMLGQIEEALTKQQYSNEQPAKYWKRQMTDMLDMMLGFGMEPPFNESKSLEAQSHVNMWEPEDENNPWRPYEKK